MHQASYTRIATLCRHAYTHSLGAGRAVGVGPYRPVIIRYLPLSVPSRVPSRSARRVQWLYGCRQDIELGSVVAAQRNVVGAVFGLQPRRAFLRRVIDTRDQLIGAGAEFGGQYQPINRQAAAGRARGAQHERPVILGDELAAGVEELDEDLAPLAGTCRVCGVCACCCRPVEMNREQTSWRNGIGAAT